MLKAADSENDANFQRLYEELKALCEEHENTENYVLFNILSDDTKLSGRYGLILLPFTLAFNIVTSPIQLVIFIREGFDLIGEGPVF